MAIEYAKAKQIKTSGGTTVEQELALKADTSSVPTKVTDLTDASDYAKKSEVASDLSGKQDTLSADSLGLINKTAGSSKYLREDGTWQTVSSGGGGSGEVEEAPIDGKQYARKNAAWEEVVASGGGGGSSVDVYVPADAVMGLISIEQYPTDFSPIEWMLNLREGMSNIIIDPEETNGLSATGAPIIINKSSIEDDSEGDTVQDVIIKVSVLTGTFFGYACEYTYFVTRNITTGVDAWQTYVYRAPLASGGGGDVEEAPTDGKQYARKDGGWEEVVADGAVNLGAVGSYRSGMMPSEMSNLVEEGQIFYGTGYLAYGHEDDEYKFYGVKTNGRLSVTVFPLGQGYPPSFLFDSSVSEFSEFSKVELFSFPSGADYDDLFILRGDGSISPFDSVISSEKISAKVDGSIGPMSPPYAEGYSTFQLEGRSSGDPVIRYAPNSYGTFYRQSGGGGGAYIIGNFANGFFDTSAPIEMWVEKDLLGNPLFAVTAVWGTHNTFPAVLIQISDIDYSNGKAEAGSPQELPLGAKLNIRLKRLV